MEQGRATPVRVACIGECMGELSGISFPDKSAAIDVAGDTLNTAIYLARALAGSAAEVSYVTALGQDGLSGAMCDRIRAEGVRTDLIARLQGRLPGLYAIETDATGERSFHYWRSTSAARSMFGAQGLRLSQLDGFDVIYLSGITLAILPPPDRAALIVHLGALRAQGRMIVFDSNYRPRLWADVAMARTSMAAMWAATALGLPSLDDEMALHEMGADAAMDRLARLGLDELVVKRGADGPVEHRAGAWVGHDLPKAPQVVDTTAAGDAFNAGYLAARIMGQAPAAACAEGHALALRVIQHPGAILPRG